MNPNRLDSWKSIAAYFGYSQRTVMRWHAERNLPVHRFPGGQGGSVFAYVSELEAWLRGQSSRPGEPALVAVRNTAPALLCDRVKHLWETRCESNLGEILDAYRNAIQADWKNAAAYAGLACSLLAGSTMSLIQGSIALLQASSAVEKSLALDPGLPEARCAEAWITFWHMHDYVTAAESFREVLRDSPDCTFAMSGQAWISSILGQRENSANLVDALLRKSGFSPCSVLAACRIHFLNGDYRKVLHIAKEAVASRTAGRAVRSLEALALLKIGDSKRAIQSLQDEARIFPDDGLIAGIMGYAYASIGDLENAQPIYEALLSMFEKDASGYGYPLAATSIAMGKTQEAVNWLEQDFAEECFHTLTLRTDPLFEALHGNERFERLVRQTLQKSSQQSKLHRIASAGF